MAVNRSIVLLAAMLLITGATARPIRQLQQSTRFGYVPSGAGCELKTSITAEKSNSRSWYSNGPVITGQVTLLNPKEYGIPVSSVQVTAQSSDSQLYTAYADCGSGSPSTYVPSNPVPYSYGQAICNYRIQLDNRVFGSAAPGSSSSSSGQPIRVGYFPDNINNNNNNPGYYPSQPTWTVTAITTIGMTNAQCYSNPATVDTSSWWSWFINFIGSSSSGSSSGGFGSSSGGLGSARPTGVGSAGVGASSQGGR